MEFNYVNNINELYKQNHYLKDRDTSILEFQMRVLDLVYLDDTPFMEKLKFLKIIHSNLEEFISTRLLDKIPIKQENLLFTIESIYQKMGDILSKINAYHNIDYAEGDTEYYQIIKDKSFRYIYAGESSDEVISEMKEVIKIKKSVNTKIVLTSDPGHDDGDIIIHVPSEILLLDKYYDFYKEIYSDNKSCFYESNIKEAQSINFYEYLRCKDMLIRNPYESYDNILLFIDQMCTNPSIRSVFITLYRTAEESKIIESLIKAKKSGKDVYVYIEPTARDNEELNIKNIQLLQKNNIYVECNYYNYKVHAKLFCAVDEDKTVYAHVGTGNYNETTAKMYTDCHLLTYNQSITVEALRVVMSLFRKDVYKASFMEKHYIFPSPLNFRNQIIRLINAEKEKGENGSICIKCNSICDCAIIDKLYRAAELGVKIKIISRTGCSIRIHKNIEVRSKVGQFLEHDRIYIFGDKSYISSADLLLRNINKRVEILCEITDEELSEKVKQIFSEIWNDKNIHILQENGNWKIG